MLKASHYGRSRGPPARAVPGPRDFGPELWSRAVPGVSWDCVRAPGCAYANEPNVPLPTNRCAHADEPGVPLPTSRCAYADEPLCPAVPPQWKRQEACLCRRTGVPVPTNPACLCRLRV